MPEQLCPGMTKTILPSGAIYLRLEHFADRDKGDVWLAREKKRMRGTPDDFDREILMQRNKFDGEPVIKNYDDKIHTRNGYFVDHPIPIIAGSIYFGLFDAGTTLRPAALLLQVTAAPFQVHAIQEVIGIGADSMETFSPRVVDAFMGRLPGNWDEVRYFGDETVNSRGGNDGRTARQVAKLAAGIDIRPVSNNWPRRRSAVEWLLSRWIDETTPGFFIDGVNCPMLRKALLGGYKWHVAAGGNARDPGAVVLKPLKNVYSDISDALQYGALQVRKLVEGGGSRVRRG